MLHIPVEARGMGICFAWKQAATVPKIPSEPTTPSTTTSMYANPARADVVHDDIDATTTIRFPFDNDHTDGLEDQTDSPKAEEPTHYEESSIHLVPVMVNDEPVANDESLNFLRKSKSKSKSKIPKLVYKVGGKSYAYGRSKDEGADAETADEGTGNYQGCWALDHVIIVNTAHLPGKLQDKFDPVDPGDWLMFPGAHFKVRHLSQHIRFYCTVNVLKLRTLKNNYFLRCS